MGNNDKGFSEEEINRAIEGLTSQTPAGDTSSKPKDESLRAFETQTVNSMVGAMAENMSFLVFKRLILDAAHSEYQRNEMLEEAMGQWREMSIKNIDMLVKDNEEKENQKKDVVKMLKLISQDMDMPDLPKELLEDNTPDMKTTLMRCLDKAEAGIRKILTSN